MNTNEVMRELDELDAATWRRAMTDTTHSPDCWCEPELYYKDPERGSARIGGVSTLFLPPNQ